MKITFDALWLGASLALMAAMVTPVRADEWNKETRLEFNAPVEVPGKVLTPGKYVFKLADSDSDRNIVQIFSEDANGAQKLVATILAIPDYREETPDKTIIQFEDNSKALRRNSLCLLEFPKTAAETPCLPAKLFPAEFLMFSLRSLEDVRASVISSVITICS